MKIQSLKLNRKFIVIFGCALALVLLLHSTSSAGAYSIRNLAGKWDRLNPWSDNALGPEHEVLVCGGNDSWHCIYEKHPEPLLSFLTPPDSFYGKFNGKDITAEWVCPGWFPSELCAKTKQVVGGDIVYATHVGSDVTFSFPAELVLTESEGTQVLYLYWVNIFACPWYRSFDEALAANPFTLPFNGEDLPEFDCLTPQ